MRFVAAALGCVHLEGAEVARMTSQHRRRQQIYRRRRVIGLAAAVVGLVVAALLVLTMMPSAAPTFTPAATSAPPPAPNASAASATPKGHGMGPDGATAACTDGTQIYDPNPRTDNACAAHGGFAKVYD
jgi:sarcosine oxidase gamma subunit